MRCATKCLMRKTVYRKSYTSRSRQSDLKVTKTAGLNHVHLQSDRSKAPPRSFLHAAMIPHVRLASTLRRAFTRAG